MGLPITDPLYGFDGTRILWAFLQDKQRLGRSRSDWSYPGFAREACVRALSG